jgi:hypothetical protein
MMQVKTPASAFVGGSDGIVMIGTPAPEETANVKGLLLCWNL